MDSELQPRGFAVGQALRWLSEQRRERPDTTTAALVEEAAQRFDLSPLEADALHRATEKR